MKEVVKAVLRQLATQALQLHRNIVLYRMNDEVITPHRKSPPLYPHPQLHIAVVYTRLHYAKLTRKQYGHKHHHVCHFTCIFI